MDSTKNAMMESSGLSDIHVIDDEMEYVFVKDEDDFDEESYDHCDLSPDLSCATSVATEVTLKDLNLSLINEGMETSIISADDERDDINSTSFAEEFTANEQSDQRSNESKDFQKTLISSKNASRPSNKKRRKKMKMMKKAAAASAAAVALAEANKISIAPATISSTMERPIQRKSRSSSTKGLRKSRVHNVAVACVHESLAAYREDSVRGKQKQSLVNYSSLL